MGLPGLLDHHRTVTPVRVTNRGARIASIATDLETAADALSQVRRDPMDPSIEIHGRIDAERSMRRVVDQLRMLD